MMFPFRLKRNITYKFLVLYTYGTKQNHKKFTLNNRIKWDTSVQLIKSVRNDTARYPDNTQRVRII